MISCLILGQAPPCLLPPASAGRGGAAARSTAPPLRGQAVRGWAAAGAGPAAGAAAGSRLVPSLLYCTEWSGPGRGSHERERAVNVSLVGRLLTGLGGAQRTPLVFPGGPARCFPTATNRVDFECSFKALSSHCSSPCKPDAAVPPTTRQSIAPGPPKTLVSSKSRWQQLRQARPRCWEAWPQVNICLGTPLLPGQDCQG